MKHVHQTFALLFLSCLLLLCCAVPARAAGPQLAKLTVSCDGQAQTLHFSPEQTVYQVQFVSADPVEVTVAAESAAGCGLSINGQRFDTGKGSLTLTAEGGCILNVQAYSANRSQLYLVYVTIVPPEEPDGGAEDGQGGGDNGGQPDPAPAPDTGDGEDGAADGGQEAGDTTDADSSTHLILYIGGPFLLANDVYIPADTAPYLVTDANGGGYTMVPVRFIAEALGAEVSWDGQRRSVGIVLDGRYFELIIGQTVPGTPVAAVIRDSRTFVPLRYVMESFGAQVGWTQAERRIDIYYSKPELY